ncbi:MAG: hypothetical protein ABI635_07630 [Actinomycetota bacterium]
MSRVPAIPGRRGVVTLATLAVLAGIALPVLASRLLITDPNDTAGLLDVHEVKFRDLDGTPPSWTVITFNDWTVRQLWDRGYVLVNLDTRRSPEVDYYALVRSDRDRLRASMWRRRVDAPDLWLFALSVGRRQQDGLEVWIPLRRLSFGADRTLYRWSVTTLFTDGPCSGTCVDLAPDTGMVDQPLVTPSPTPSPT